MKTLSYMLLTVLIILVLLPAMLVKGADFIFPRTDEPQHQITNEEFNYLIEKSSEKRVKLYKHRENEIVELSLEEYLIGVVAAEMPASFDIEALKSQAVAARTYALRRLEGNPEENELHPGAHLCSNHIHCQAWQSSEELAKKWGKDNFQEKYDKIRIAVANTAGKALTKNGELIESVYHSTCGGHTEDAAYVWEGGSVPYLAQVQCGYCQHSPWYEVRETAIPVVNFANSFRITDLQTVSTTLEKKAIEVIDRTPSGRVNRINIGNETYRGVEVRSKLDLPSADFSWKENEGQIIFMTQGYGHGVGLCQYGADGMGKKGYNFTEILHHYYNNIEIINY